MRKYRKYHEVLIESLKADPEHTHTYLQVAVEEFELDDDNQASFF